jgi:L,D-transpeptidase catalytic domain
MSCTKKPINMKNTLLVFLLSFICCKNSSFNLKPKDYSAFNNEALEFCKNNNYNKNYYFLLDLSLHSGTNRFFVYDFNKKKIINKNLVTHGSCDQFDENELKWEKAKFDVKENSHCSMVGKYKIGKRDYSSWGINIKYWLHGLDKSNKTAIDRVIVLHSWDAVANNEIYPKFSPLSWGCPAVSDDFMKLLDEKLQKTDKPVLLWIME